MDSNDQFVTKFHGEFAGRRQSPCAGMRVLTECYLGLRTDNSRKYPGPRLFVPDKHAIITDP